MSFACKYVNYHEIFSAQILQKQTASLSCERRVMPTSVKPEASQINLSMTYLPLDRLRRGLFPTHGAKRGTTHSGLLFVQLVRAFNVVSQVRKNLFASYCVLRLGNKPPKKSRVVKDSVDPEWNENFEWFDACVRDVLVIEFLHVGNFMDTSLGHVKMSAGELSTIHHIRFDSFPSGFIFHKHVFQVHLFIKVLKSSCPYFDQAVACVIC